MSEARFAPFLHRSFAALRVEVPDIYAETCRRMAPRSVRIETDGEAVHMSFEKSAVRFDADSGATIDVRTSRDAILALVAGEITLAQAVLDDALWLRGEADDLLAFHDGLMAYLHGAIRAPSFPALLRDYRSHPPSTTVPPTKRKDAA